jgi:hypothetical protein
MKWALPNGVANLPAKAKGNTLSLNLVNSLVSTNVDKNQFLAKSVEGRQILSTLLDLEYVTCLVDSYVPGIYAIINVVTKEAYVGETSSLATRLKRHYQDLNNNKHDNTALQNAVNLYGISSFIKRAYSSKTIEILYFRKNYEIFIINSWPYGVYNVKLY